MSLRPGPAHRGSCVFQSSRYILHLVPESAEVYPLHIVASVQMGDTEGTAVHADGCVTGTVLLQYARIHRQKDVQRLACSNPMSRCTARISPVCPPVVCLVVCHSDLT